MALPDKIRFKTAEFLSAYCAMRCPAKFKDKVKLGFRFRGNSVALYEERPVFRSPGIWVDIVVAKFRFDPKSSL